MVFTFLTGGARSGKSSLALELAADHKAVTFIATAPNIPGDDDLAARVALHRAERPPHWATIEEPHDLVGALDRAGSTFAVVDCLTLWVNNLLWRGDDPAQIEVTARRAAELAAARPASTVVVSNEVGLGIHPHTEVGRTYQDLLGRVNTTMAATADRALLLVAGRALRLDDPSTLL